MPSYAYYRLPYADSYTAMTQTEEEPERLSSYSELNCRSGFVVAPFTVTDATPILLLHPNKVEEKALPENDSHEMPGKSRNVTSIKKTSDRRAYAEDFSRCHAGLTSGEFQKIVLARCAEVETPVEIQAERLFQCACRLYPRMFVALVSTPLSGTWLMATPEILLEGEDDQWRTIALAGTMRLEGDNLCFDCPPSQEQSHGAPGIFWSTKNIQEQRYVATYIAECLKRYADNCHEEGPRTVRAGNVVHLRSDFNFRLPDCRHLGDLLSLLHPTPAVCGLPKADAWCHIVEHEHTPRSYYSGFAGPLMHDGSTHLYVSLRCMRIVDGRHYRLYAGGGLLKDSDEEQEWIETEAKMETMLDILENNV